MNTIELYESPDGAVSVNVRADGDTVWLTQRQLATLFGRDVSVVRRHIANVRREELVGISTSAKFALVQQEGSREVERFGTGGDTAPDPVAREDVSRPVPAVAKFATAQQKGSRTVERYVLDRLIPVG